SPSFPEVPAKNTAPGPAQLSAHSDACSGSGLGSWADRFVRVPSALPSPFEAPQDSRRARGAPFRCLAPVVALYASKAASSLPAPEERRSPSGDLIFVTRIVAFMA
ncbi:MAG: hypothetical protein Q4P24_18465, partial [Rhodobacterales bacterium]|nr:hypothetical protein [Rhodobacterales bacterium]